MALPFIRFTRGVHKRALLVISVSTRNLEMNDTGSSKQFSIANLSEWTAVAALLIALAAPQSGLSMLFISLLVPAFVVCKCCRMGLNPIVTGVITGFCWPVAFMFSVIVVTVRKAEIVQGQLYTEDGPGMFFMACALFLIFFGGLLSLLGAIAGAAFHFGNRYD